MAKPSEEQTKRADGLRERAKTRMRERRLSASAAGKLAGLISQTMNEFLKGRVPSDENMDRIEAWLDGATRDTRDGPLPYNEDREEEDLSRIGKLPDALVRTMERESIAAVIRAQSMRDACRAARIEAEKAPSRNLPEGFSSADVEWALRQWRTWQRRREGRGEGPTTEKPEHPDQTPPDE